MEAPEPIFKITIKDNDIITDEFNISIKSDKNNIFDILIKNFSSYLIIYAKNKSNFENEYEKKYYLEDLNKIKYLAGYDSIVDIFDQFKYEFKKENIKLFEGNNTIKINIPIELVKIKELIFELPLKKKNNNDMINTLIEEVNVLKKEIKILKDENIYLKKTLNKYMPYLDKLIKDEEKIKNNININNKENNEFNKKNVNNSKFQFDLFKNNFMKSKKKGKILKKLWDSFDAKNYSIWRLEYLNLPNDFKELLKTSNRKEIFLQTCKTLKNITFAVLGVYGIENDYKIRGVWMFKGTDIPKKLKKNIFYEYIDFKRLDSSKEEDRELIHDYWTKISLNNVVEGKKCVDVTYFG